MRAFKIGLKLWSTNLQYIAPAQELHARGVFDYLELFTVPGSLETISQWKELEIPYVLHAPHTYAGLNPSDYLRRDDNLKLVEQVACFVDALNPAYVIFHPGVGGDFCETIAQFNLIGKKFLRVSAKVLIENKPKRGLKGENCLGASVAEVRQVLAETGFGFCLDFGHAICASVSLGLSWRGMIEDFIALKPVMFHLSDGDYSEQDCHDHFGTGQFDLPGIIRHVHSGAMVSVETKKDFSDQLDDFVSDAQFLKRLMVS